MDSDSIILCSHAFFMKTKFTKFSDSDHIPNWSNFFRAGDSWLQSLQVLDDNKDNIGWGIFYVKPWVVAFCLELFVKSIAAHEDSTFEGKEYYHRTTKIIEKYKNIIPIFEKIFSNHPLFLIMKEYENTIDTKFGETSVSIDGDDQNKLIEMVYELRGEICKRTGLR